MQLRADRATRGNLHLYAPELSDEEAALTGVNIIGRDELAEAVKSSVARQGTGGRVAVVPEGPCVHVPSPTALLSRAHASARGRYVIPVSGEGAAL